MLIIFNDDKVLNIVLVLQNSRDLFFHVRCRNVNLAVVGTGSVSNSRQIVRNGIGFRHLFSP